MRQTTRIDKSGNSYSGSGDYTYYDLDGNPIPSISGTVVLQQYHLRARLRYGPVLDTPTRFRGDREDAQKIIDHLHELSVHQYVAPYNVAVIYAGLGNKDDTFVWLNRAYEERSYLLMYLTVDERLDSLHSDPRFDELVRRVGLPTPRLHSYL